MIMYSVHRWLNVIIQHININVNFCYRKLISTLVLELFLWLLFLKNNQPKEAYFGHILLHFEEEKQTNKLQKNTQSIISYLQSS